VLANTVLLSHACGELPVVKCCLSPTCYPANYLLLGIQCLFPGASFPMLDTRCLLSGAYYPSTVSQLLFFVPVFELPLIRYLLSIAQFSVTCNQSFLLGAYFPLYDI
jgi:hypothetical protein